MESDKFSRQHAMRGALYELEKSFSIYELASCKDTDILTVLISAKLAKEISSVMADFCIKSAQPKFSGKKHGCVPSGETPGLRTATRNK